MSRSAVIRTSFGMVAAALVLEAALRPFLSPAPPPEPAIAVDSLSAPVVAFRQVDEGVATSHYSAAGARLTGNTPLPAAPVVVILGDSHVQAREVPDSATLGAVLERRARSEGVPVNVRQYGWRGASPPQYVAVAPAVLSRWHPRLVIVVLGHDDLYSDPLVGQFPRMRIAADGSVSILPGDSAEPVPSRTAALLRHSVLLTAVVHRWERLMARAPAAMRRALGTSVMVPDESVVAGTIPAVPRAVVRSLHDAFGARLLIVDAAEVRTTGGEEPEIGEERLMTACRELGVTCVSTRSAMLSARAAGVITRGFPSTTLGIGHLNAAGHHIVADVIWRALAASPAPPVRPRFATGR